MRAVGSEGLWQEGAWVGVKMLREKAEKEARTGLGRPGSWNRDWI